jgi:septum formation protein
MAAAPLILASGSKARADLLRAAGLAFEVVAPPVDERTIESSWPGDVAPDEAARLLASEKALAVSRMSPAALVIGADQTLALGRERFTKATTLAEARATLVKLRGRTHALHSAFALARGGMIVADQVGTARMTMRSVSDEGLEDYLDRAGAAILGSVGCYQLEGLGVTLFSAVEGDYFTVLGLPLLDLLASLRGEGVIAS